MKTSGLLGILFLAIAVGGLVATNPTADAYELYALEQADEYVTDEVCNSLPQGLDSLLGDQCAEVTATLEPTLEAVIRDRTQRLNLGIASIYRTSLGIPEVSMLPRYEIETIGILGRFITYRAVQVE